MLTIATGIAWPQTTSPPSQPNPPSQQATPDRAAPPQGEPAPPPVSLRPEENPGLFNDIGKMFEKSLSIFPPLKSPGETIDDFLAVYPTIPRQHVFSFLELSRDIAIDQLACASS